MKEKSFISKFFLNFIVKNIILALLVIALLVIVAMISLDIITKHNQSLVLPDFTNLYIKDAVKKAKKTHVKIEIVDSVYVKGMPKGAVFMQIPKAGSKVKKGRRVQLTINSISPKKVSMPNLVGYSIRQARAEMAFKGLQIGKLIYVPDMATNNVINQLYKSQDILPKTIINSGSKIDLVLGLNANDQDTHIPNLNGLDYKTAMNIVYDNSLNLDVSFDSTVKTYRDSLNAVVYKQSPISSDMLVQKGTSVHLYLSLGRKINSSNK